MEDKPFYVGISGGIIRRIQQNVKGKDHFTSSLCYKIGADYYLKENNNKKHKGGRKGLDFEKYGGPAKTKLSEECSFTFMKLNNDIELYLFEAYVAIHLETLHYNNFSTH